MPLTPPPAGTPPRPRLVRHSGLAWPPALAWAAVLAVLLLAVLLIVLRGLPGTGASQATGEAPAGSSDALAMALDRALQRSTAALAPGLAVRPLATPQGETESALLADAVCDELVALLARLPDLRVPSCASTRLALVSELDDNGLARLLRVGHVLQGELQALPADRVRVQLAMHDVQSGHAVWRLDEELPTAALQRLPARVAGAVAPALGHAPPVVSPTALAPAAYADFRRAEQLFRRPSIDDRREALRLVEGVLVQAPEHAPSLYLRHALRARLDGLLHGPLGGHADAATLAAAQAVLNREAQALGTQMVARDPADRRGHILLLNAALTQGRWADVFDHADTLLLHAHRQPRVLRLAAQVHLMAGYVSRAQALAQEAARLDALDAEAIEYLAITHGMQGDDAALREWLTIAAQLGHGGLAFFDVVRAHRRADWPAVEQALTTYAAGTGHPTDWVAPVVRGMADPGQRAAAVQVLNGLDEGLRFYLSDFFFELALLGATDESLAAIQMYARQQPRLWLEYLWWPELAALRSRSGFAEAMADIGLTALWAERGAPDLCAADAAGTWACR
jgi:TolB-like protein